MNVAKLAGLPVCKRSAMMGEVFVAGCCGPTRRANVGAFRAAIAARAWQTQLAFRPGRGNAPRTCAERLRRVEAAAATSCRDASLMSRARVRL